MYIRKQGSVTNMIVTGDYNNTINRLREMRPVLMDILPLTLEEVFTYEMQKLGYNFDDVLNS